MLIKKTSVNFIVVLLLSVGTCSNGSAQDSLNVTLLGEYDFHSLQVKNTIVEGNLAYVSAGEGGFKIFDVSDPNRPVIISEIVTAGCAYGLDIAGDYAYAGDFDGFSIVDISDPHNPQSLSYSPVPWCGHLKFHENYVYALGFGITIFDVSNPVEPVEVAYQPRPRQVSQIVFTNDLVYLTSGFELRVCELVSPTVFDLIGQASLAEPIMDVYVTGSLAYVADYYNGLCIIDVSDPTDPVEIGQCDTPDQAESVFASENFAYLSIDDLGFAIADVTNPADPTIIYTQGWEYFCNDVFVSDGLAYVAAEYDGMRIFDVVDPYQPLELGYTYQIGRPRGIDVLDQTAYLACSNGGLTIADVSNPDDLILLGNCDSPGYAKDIVVENSYAYVAYDEDGTRIFDVSDPMQPIEISSVLGLPGSHAERLILSGNHLFVSFLNAGFQIIDVADPFNPVLVSYTTTGGSSGGMSLSGDYLYIADYSIFIYDVSDLSAPIEALVYPTPGTAKDVTTCNDLLYVADGSSGGLTILNISDPLNPFEESSTITAGDAENLDLLDDFVFLADESSGFSVYDAYDISNPTLTGYYNDWRNTNKVKVVESRLYACCSEWLGIFNVYQAAANPIPNRSERPVDFTLYPPHPNPFNASTIIRYQLPVAGEVNLAVYDVSGRVVAELLNRFQTAGRYEIPFDASNLASGVYIYQIVSDRYRDSGKAVLLK